MATFNLTIADTDVDRVFAALSAAGGFSETSEKNAFKTVLAFIQQTVANVETSAAQQAAEATIIAPTPVVLS